MHTLEIKDLHVSVGDIEILKGINLTINSKETHALLGPNGHGKSTLLNTIMGHPKYIITKGSIIFDGKDITHESVDVRARMGLFLAMQYPLEISGVNESDFIRSAINARNEKPISLYKYIKELETATKTVGFDLDVAHRYLNEGFSGGEKKRNELLQLLMLKPYIALFDELDSGLDVDALNTVAKVINDINNTNEEFASIIVSHYAKMYNLVKPSHVHIIVNGKIVMEGDAKLVERVDKEGYEWLTKEKGIVITKERKVNPTMLGSCGRKVTKE